MEGGEQSRKLRAHLQPQTRMRWHGTGNKKVSREWRQEAAQPCLSCRSPWPLPTAPALSWHHSALHMAAVPGRPEAASSAPLGGAELSSNYRQPALGQPQPVPSIPSEAWNCGLKSATEAAWRRSVGEACQLSHAALPRPFRKLPVSLWCLMQEAAGEPVVHHTGGILSVVSSSSQATVKR